MSISVPIISVLLALGVIGIPAVALWGRVKTNKGIGWQFIRFTVISAALPLVGILALNNVLTAESSTLLGTAIGYAFGHSSDTRGDDV